MTDLNDLIAFVAVAEAGGFRDAAKKKGTSPSTLSEAVRRLEENLGIRLLNRSTRSVVTTEAGAKLLERLVPVLGELEASLSVVNTFKGSAGTLKLNVPSAAARLILPSIIPPFMAAYPEVKVEVIVEERLVDVLAAGCDAGIRYDSRLELDMIAVPIGPRVQRYATAASPAYLKNRGRPKHPRDLLKHSCLRGQFSNGTFPVWEFERDGETVLIDPAGPLVIRPGAAIDLAIAAAVHGQGIVCLFEDSLRPQFEAGTLVPVLQPWWRKVSGPFLYYPSRRMLPAPLRAFVNFIQNNHS